MLYLDGGTDKTCNAPDLIANALVEQARLIELVRTERLEVVESIAKTACQEINNPLNAIITLTQLILKRQPLDQDIQRLAWGIAKAATQAVEAVQKLQIN